MVKSCRNTKPRVLNQSRFITNRTGRRITDCHRFILIQVRCAAFGSKPAMIMIRWNFLGFFPMGAKFGWIYEIADFCGGISSNSCGRY